MFEQHSRKTQNSLPPLISEAERHKLLVEWNATRAAYPRETCLHHMFELQAARTPDAPALVVDEHTLTYQVLNARANQLAHYLQMLGVGIEAPVGVCLDRTPDLVIGLLAILKAGGAYVPLDPAYPQDRLAFMLQDSQIRIVLTQENLRACLPELDQTTHLICVERDWAQIALQPAQDVYSHVTARNLAYVIYTSGSTGRPKGVACAHMGVLNLLSDFQQKQPLNPGDRGSLWTSINFDVSVYELFSCLCSGGTLYLVPELVRAQSEALFAWIAQHTIQSAYIAPFQLSELAQWLRQDGHQPDLKRLLVGVEPIQEALLCEIAAHVPGLHVINGYGPTEATVCVTLYPLDPATSPPRITPLGRPVQNIRMYVLDEDMKPVPIGAPGEIYVGGDGLARGYLNRPELTAERFVPDPFGEQPGERLYRTGDWGKYLPDGNLEFVGRADQQAKIRGYRIEPGEIEAVLSQHPAVGACAVLARAAADGDKRLVAYVTPAGEHDTSALVATLRTYTKLQLPAYMVPSAFVILPTLPITPNGKIDRRALPEPDWEHLDPRHLYTAPRTALEEKLVEIRQKTLHIEHIDVHEDFFALGGHSLLAIREASRLREAFQVEVPLRVLFEEPTVARLAEHLERAIASERDISISSIHSAPRDAYVPASFTQEQLWFLDQLETGHAFYNMSVAARFNRRLRADVVEQSIHEIIRRHEALRTTLASNAGRPVQVIAPHLPLGLSVVDISRLPQSLQHGEIERQALHDAHLSFDLQRGPLLRARLFQLNPAHSVLLLTWHHVITDDWSVAVFFRELSLLYEAFSAGMSSSLPALPIQYADYAIWQRNWLQGEELAQHLSYWRTSLAGAPGLLELPYDHPRPSVQSYRGAHHSFALSADLSARLQELSQQRGVTLYMTLLAAFQVLLWRYTGQTDLLVGTPTTGRTRAQVEGLIGFFVNTLVLRGDLAGNPSFLELLEQVRAVALEAFAHQEAPFERVVEALRPARSLSYHPLVQVMFALQNVLLEGVEWTDLGIDLLELETGISRFDLTLEFTKAPTGLQGRIEYSTDLFDASTIAQLAGHLSTLLAGVADDPTQHIAELPLLLQSEQHRLLQAWNATSRDYPRELCLHEQIEAQVALTPDSIALVNGACHLSYGELDERATNLARHLQALGIGPEQRVGVCMERSLELVIGQLSVLKAGGAYVPLDPAYPSERLAFMMRDAHISVLLTHQNLAGQFTGQQRDFILLCLDQDWPALVYSTPSNFGGTRLIASALDKNDSTPDTIKRVPPKLQRKATTANLAYIIYTSGSTGQPKGTCITHQSVSNLLNWHHRAFAVSPTDRATSLAGLSFDASVWELWPYLASGACICLVDDQTRLDPARLQDWLQAEQITLSFVPTPLAERLLQLPWEKQAALRQMLTGGDALHQAPPAGLPFSLVNNYGPTESTVVTTSGIVDAQKEAHRAPAIGLPIDNTQVYLLDEQMQPVPPRVAGELYIGGAGLARGYLDRPDLTAGRFMPNPFGEAGSRLYKTGDRVRYRSDGNLEFLGRMDNQVKLRGYRIELGEIESVLCQHPLINDAIVLLLTQPDPWLIAYVIPAQGANLALSELPAYMREQVPAYMAPAIYVRLDAFPLTSNGKVDRQTLRALAESERNRITLAGTYVAPQTPTEDRLAKIWAEILGLDRIGIHDDFFALGGHSLLATQVVTRIHETLHVNVPLRALFEAPTVAALASSLDQALLNGTNGHDRSPLSALPRNRSGLEQVLGLLVPLSIQDLQGLLAPNAVCFPLSYAQQRLWLLDQLEPGNPSYNIPTVIRLRGQLDVAALARSCQALVQRHEALRTTFTAVRGQPVQIIIPNLDITIRMLDISGIAELAREAELQRQLQLEAQHRFNLARGPLMRISLLRVHRLEHVLLINLHHIIADGWSINLLMRELAALYFTPLASLPALPIQYADYAVWQRQWHQSEEMAPQLDYWRTQLAGAPAFLDLPADHPRPAIQTYRARVSSLLLSKSLSDHLRSLSQHEGVTLYMTLLSIFLILLQRYSGQTDLVVGTPVANRHRTAIEGLIGFFINALALRVDLADALSLRDLLRHVREVALQAYTHQDLSIDRLIEELKPERSLSHTPLFQVFFNMVNLPAQKSTWPALNVDISWPYEGGSKFDFTLYTYDLADGIRLELVYNADLFAQARMDELLRQFEHLAGQTRAAQVNIADLSLVTAAARAVLPDPRVPLSSAWEGAVHHLFARHARHVPEQIAIVDAQHRLSYKELDARTNQLANYLLAYGIQRQDVVAIYGYRSAALVQAILGTLKAGAAFLILDPAYPPTRLSDYLRLANPRAWVQIEAAGALPDELEASVASMSWCCRLTLSASGSPHLSYTSDDPAIPVGPDDLACVTFTSGSTGRPKGILQRHGPLSHFIPWQKQRFGLTEADRYSMLSGLSHDPLQREIFTPLSLGATICIPSMDEIGVPGRLAQWMRQEDITVAHLTPALMQLLTQTVPETATPAFELASLHCAFTVGDVLTKRDVSRLWKLAPSVTCVNFYGSTETQRAVGYFVVQDLSEHAKEIIPLGQGMPDVQLLVLNASHQLAGIGEVGEIYVRSPHLARGYLGDAALTQERFIPNPFTHAPGDRLYKTGDLGRYLPDGNVEYAGRSDQQVKLRGFRIEPGEIEAVLGLHPAVREATVIAREDTPGNKLLVAYVVSARTEPSLTNELRSFLGSRLPAYMVPSAFVRLDALPLTPNGKIDRHALPAPEAVTPTSESVIAPRTPVEEILVSIWAQVLDSERVGIYDNFFDLGGHSLLGMQLIARVCDAFHMELSLRTLFEASTVADLATAIERRSTHTVSPRSPALVRLPRNAQSRKQALPPSFQRKDHPATRP